MTLIIGLSGAAGAGKSTVANYLVEKYGAKKYSFADPLKEIARKTLNFTHEQLHGTQREKEAIDPRYGFSPRWFLQRLGTEGIRTVLGDDTWAEYCLKRIQADAPGTAVIEDLRFQNEAKVLRHGFSTDSSDWGMPGMWSSTKVWQLINPNRQSQADSTHQSEAEWKQIEPDYIIAPTSFDQLYPLVDQACMAYNIFPRRRELPL